MILKDTKEKKTRSFEIFEEKNFGTSMQTEANPFLDKLRKIHKVQSAKGGDIYCETFMPKGNCYGMIVIFHGFCEFCAKFDEFTYYMLKQDFAICRFDHRGHGFSARDIPTEPSKVYIDDFQTYVNDAHTVITEVVEPMAKEIPLFLFAHSMGGAIGALFLQQYPRYFKAVALSSPMFTLRVKGLPFWFERIFVKFVRYRRGAKSYIPSQHDFNAALEFDSEKRPTISEDRFAYSYAKRLSDERLQTWSGTMAWLDESLDAIARIKKKKNCKKISTPILLLQAEKDETVLPQGQNDFAVVVPSAKLLVYPNANHELYNTKNAILVSWYTDLIEFYAKYC